MGFMDKAFETVIVFSAVDMVTAPMNKMALSMGLLSARSKETQGALNNLRNVAFVGAGITAIGAVLAAGLISAANAAGVLETSMMNVKEALSLTNAEYRKATNMALALAGPTQFSSQTVGAIMASAANAGMSKSAVLDPDTMKQYVNFADVQAQSTKKEDPVAVVAAAVKMANLAGVTGQAATAKFLDQVNAALMHVTDTGTQFATNMRYYVGTAEQKGMSPSDIVTANTWLSRMGLGGGRGGMATQQFLSRGTYGSSGTAADAAMKEAGFVVDGHSVFDNAKGAFIGFPAAMKALQDFNTREGGNANITGPLLTKIFGVSGMRVAQAMMQASAAPQYAQVQQQLGSTAGVNDIQAALNATWFGQTTEMMTNLKSLWIEFGQSATSSLLPLLTHLNTIIYDFLLFTQAHPAVMDLIADFVKWAAAISLIVGPLMVVVGALGWIGKSGYIVSGLQMISKALGFMTFGLWDNVEAWAAQKAAMLYNAVATKVLTAVQWLFNASLYGCPIIWIIVGLAAIGVAIYLLVTHWKEVCSWIQTAWTFLKNNPILMFVLGPLGILLAALDLVITHWKEICAWIENAWNWLTKWFKAPQPSGPGGSSGIAGAQYYASGTNYAPGGWSWVGEHGAELVNLSRGSQVIDNATATGMLGGVSMGGVSINIYPTPNQSPVAIAKAVKRELGAAIRTDRRSRTLAPRPAW